MRIKGYSKYGNQYRKLQSEYQIFGLRIFTKYEYISIEDLVEYILLSIQSDEVIELKTRIGKVDDNYLANCYLSKIDDNIRISYVYHKYVRTTYHERGSTVEWRDLTNSSIVNHSQIFLIKQLLITYLNKSYVTPEDVALIG